jgi:hypothetical protein
MIRPVTFTFYSEVDMTLHELNLAIVKWADDRKILAHSSAYAQAFKTAEEVKELVEALYLMRYLMAYKVSDWDYQHERTHEQIMDAIGDIYVTLIVGSTLYDEEYCDLVTPTSQRSSVVPSSVPNPVDRLQKALIPLGAACKGQGAYWMGWLLMVSYLSQIAEEAGTTLVDCVKQAYDQIKDRKGHLTAEGIFVKEEV